MYHWNHDEAKNIELLPWIKMKYLINSYERLHSMLDGCDVE